MNSVSPVQMPDIYPMPGASWRRWRRILENHAMRSGRLVQVARELVNGPEVLGTSSPLWGSFGAVFKLDHGVSPVVVVVHGPFAAVHWPAPKYGT